MQAFRVAQMLTLGYTGFGARGFERNSRTFAPAALDIDLRRRTFIVTGCTSGLGRATAHALADRGGVIHMLCRDAERGERARSDIVKESGNEDVHLHVCDLANLDDIARFCDMWKTAGTPIDALVNNAGIMLHQDQKAASGLEANFAINTLGTYALTEMLRPVLEAGNKSRVITVSSGGMLTVPLVVDDLEGRDLAKNGAIDGSTQYARNKRQQVALTEHWAAKSCSSNVFYAAMHPGWAATPGLEKAMPDFFSALKTQMRTTEQGADTIVYLSISEEAVRFPSGEFFFDRCPVPKHLWLSGTQYSPSKAEALAEKLDTLLKDRGYSLSD